MDTCPLRMPLPFLGSPPLSIRFHRRHGARVSVPRRKRDACSCASRSIKMRNARSQAGSHPRCASVRNTGGEPKTMREIGQQLSMNGKILCCCEIRHFCLRFFATPLARCHPRKIRRSSAHARVDARAPLRRTRHSRRMHRPDLGTRPHEPKIHSPARCLGRGARRRLRPATVGHDARNAP